MEFNEISPSHVNNRAEYTEANVLNDRGHAIRWFRVTTCNFHQRGGSCPSKFALSLNHGNLYKALVYASYVL